MFMVVMVRLVLFIVRKQVNILLYLKQSLDKEFKMKYFFKFLYMFKKLKNKIINFFYFNLKMQIKIRFIMNLNNYDEYLINRDILCFFLG